MLHSILFAPRGSRRMRLNGYSCEGPEGTISPWNPVQDPRLMVEITEEARDRSTEKQRLDRISREARQMTHFPSSSNHSVWSGPEVTKGPPRDQTGNKWWRSESQRLRPRFQHSVYPLHPNSFQNPIIFQSPWSVYLLGSWITSFSRINLGLQKSYHLDWESEEG